MADATEIGVDITGLAEALKFTASQAERAAGAEGKIEILPIPNDPHGEMLVVKPDGKYEMMSLTPVPRNHALGSTGEVQGYVERITEAGDDREPSVWFSQSAIVVLDDDSVESRRLDRATVKLEFTPQFKKLVEIGGNVSKGQVPVNHRQREFIKLFTRDLCDCLPTDILLALVKSLRAIDFEVSGTTTSNIGRGKESMGASIKEEIRSSAGPIPEMLVFNVPVFTDRDVNTKFNLRFLVEIDIKQQCFTLEAFAGEIDNAVQSAVESVGSVLRAAMGESVPVFCGCP